jgi:hypothetical protein
MARLVVRAQSRNQIESRSIGEVRLVMTNGINTCPFEQVVV